MRFEQKSKIYPIHANAALVIDQYVAAYISLKYDQDHGAVPAEIQSVIRRNGFDLLASMGRLPCGYSDIGMACMVLDSWEVMYERYPVCFAGLRPEFPSMTENTGQKSVEGDELAFIRPDRKFEAFHPAYADADELLDEFRSKLRRCMPDSFDWWANIMNIMGQHVQPQVALDALLDFLR